MVSFPESYKDVGDGVPSVSEPDSSNGGFGFLCLAGKYKLSDDPDESELDTLARFTPFDRKWLLIGERFLIGGDFFNARGLICANWAANFFAYSASALSRSFLSRS